MDRAVVKVMSDRYQWAMSDWSEPPPSSPERTAEALLHLARLARGEGAGGGDDLTPAQWTALRFFARANRFSRTPSAFASYHATTRGTASQTVRSLVEAGYLERRRSRTDGRSVDIAPTDAGDAALARDPLFLLADTIAALPAERQRRLAADAGEIAGGLAARQGARAFGVCAECRHLAETAEGGACPYRCRLADAGLEARELGLICIDFAPREGTAGEGTGPA